jgi:hypothetical protein
MVGELIGVRVRARVIREGDERDLELVPGELVA